MRTLLPAASVLIVLTLAASCDGKGDPPSSAPPVITDAGDDPDSGTSGPDGSLPVDAGSLRELPSFDDYTAAADYSEANGGLAFVVSLDDEVVFEQYAPEYAGDSINHIHSATKGFWGVAVAAMVEDGILDSFDEVASDTIVEWEDPERSQITLRHLLTLSSGLAEDVPALQGLGGSASDKYLHAIGMPAVAPPGERFRYGPSSYYSLGMLLERRLAARGQTPLDYLRERIFEPIGLEYGDWAHDPAGHPHIPNGAYVSPLEWIRFGQLVVNGGTFDGDRIVDAELLAQCLAPSAINAGHGLTLWLNQPGGIGSSGQQAPPGSEGGFLYNDGLPDMAAAAGAGQNVMFMIPSLRMVIVRQADNPPRSDRISFTELFRKLFGSDR